MLIQNCSLLTGKVSLLCQRQTTRRSWPESSRLCIPLNANPSAWRSCLRKLIGRREYNPPQVLKPNPSCCLSSPRLAQKYYAETPPKGENNGKRCTSVSLGLLRVIEHLMYYGARSWSSVKFHSHTYRSPRYPPRHIAKMESAFLIFAAPMDPCFT